jgi:hypothetical protein
MGEWRAKLLPSRFSNQLAESAYSEHVSNILFFSHCTLLLTHSYKPSFFSESQKWFAYLTKWQYHSQIKIYVTKLKLDSVVNIFWLQTFFSSLTPGASLTISLLGCYIQAHLRKGGQLPAHSWPDLCPKTFGFQAMMSFDIGLHNPVNARADKFFICSNSNTNLYITLK